MTRNGLVRRGLSSIATILFLLGSFMLPAAMAQPVPQNVAPGVWRMRFGEPETVTPVGICGQAPLVQAMQKMPKAVMPLDAARTAFRAGRRGCVVELPMDRAEQIFGLGLHPATFNLTGTVQSTVVSDEQQFEDGGSHAPVPFYVSTRGYGVLIDTPRYARFYMGNLSKAPASSTIEAVTSPSDLRREVSRAVSVEIPSARGVDVYVFAGPELKDAICRYNLFSGGGCLPPLWGLGVYYRGYGSFDAAGVLKLATCFRERHIPCSVFGLEPGWQSHTYSCSYVWSKERWPRPDEFVRQMKDMGYELNLWEHAFVHPTAPF